MAVIWEPRPARRSSEDREALNSRLKCRTDEELEMSISA